jgi:hypothetical protein
MSLDAGLKDLCVQYNGAPDLAGSYDSIRLEQRDFIGDYLQESKSLPSDRFTFGCELPDTLPSSRYNALMHVIFQSLDSSTE